MKLPGSSKTVKAARKHFCGLNHSCDVSHSHSPAIQTTSSVN